MVNHLSAIKVPSFVTVAVIRISSSAINLIRVFTVVPGIPSSSFAPTRPVYPPFRTSLLSSALAPVELMYQGHLRSDTTPLALNVFVLHAMPSSCPMDGVHCLLVLNIFCPLGLQVSLVQHPPSLVFAVCIFCNVSNHFAQNFTGLATVFFAPSTSVGTALLP